MNDQFYRHEEYEDMIRDSAAHWFSTGGNEVLPRRRYILADRSDWKDNIIVPEVANFVELVKPLHKWIHHGCSSQAMLFNLLGPLIYYDDLSPLLQVLIENGIDNVEDWYKPEFEYHNKAILDEVRPTSIDLALKTHDGYQSVFIEAKLVEREFGGCSVFQRGDCDGMNPVKDFNRCYLHNKGIKYWQVMNKYGLLEKIKDDNTCIFINYYQFFRELMLSLKYEGVFVILYDERNPTFYSNNYYEPRGLIPFLTSLLPETHKPKVKTITIQQVVKSIVDSGRHDSWIEEFKDKYGVD